MCFFPQHTLTDAREEGEELRMSASHSEISLKQDSLRLSAQIQFHWYLSTSAKVKMREEWARPEWEAHWNCGALLIHLSAWGKRGDNVSCPLFIIHTIHGSSLYEPPKNMRRYGLSWLLRPKCLLKLSREFFLAYTEFSPLNKCLFLNVDPVHMK